MNILAVLPKGLSEAEQKSMLQRVREITGKAKLVKGLDKSYWFCKDCCATNPTLFVLKRELWESITSDTSCILCLECCENRLGRFLVVEDFALTEEMKLILGVAGYECFRKS